MVRSMFALVTLVAISSCRLGSEPDPVSIRIESASAFSPGMAYAPFSLVVRNGSSKTIGIRPTGCPGFEVRNTRGAFVGPALVGAACIAILPLPIEIAPNETRVFPRTWVGLRQWGQQPEPLPPGRYLLRTEILVDDVHRWTPSVSVEVRP